MRISREHEPDTAAQPPAERAPAASPAPLGALAPTSDRGALARAALGLQRTQGNRSLARALLARKPAPPDYLVTPQFCGVTVAPGVNPTMAERLAKVEKHLHEVVWPAMPADAKFDRKTGAPTDDVDKWLGIGSVAGWKPGAWHASGSAVDVDAAWGPYIATRNFDALSIWMMYAIPHNKPAMIRRAPIADVHDPAKVSDDDLLAKIPESERLSKDIGVQLVREDMERDWWKQIHPQGWPQTPEQVYFQVLRDYEMVRVPMVSGAPQALPGTTRNPVHGFIHHRKALVEAMVEVGKLRWGACDFGIGVDGDTHHFDLNSHAGYEPTT